MTESERNKTGIIGSIIYDERILIMMKFVMATWLSKSNEILTTSCCVEDASELSCQIQFVLY